MRGALKFIDDDLPRAFGDARRPAPARRPRRRVRPKRRTAIGALHRVPRDRARAAQRAARSASAATSSSRSCGSTRASRSPLDRLLAIAMRELQATQEEFRRVAGTHERRRSARGLGEDQGTSIPPPGELVRRPRSSSSTSSQTFLERQTIVTLPGRRADHRRADAATSTAGRSPACGRRARSRRKPTRAYYYLTDVDPSWPPERQDEHLRDFNYATLWSISIHEVYPGPLPPLPAPAAGRVEGCASRSCSRRRRSSKAGRTTASR